MDNIKFEPNAVFPELVAKGIAKWYLFDYDEFLNTEIITEVSNWCMSNGVNVVKADIYRYYGREDFAKYRVKILPFTKKEILSFLYAKVLDEQSRELFLESAYITDSEKIMIYLEKGCEVVLIGVSNFDLAKSFETKIVPYLNSTLNQRIDYVFNYPLKHHHRSEEAKELFIRNYFKNSGYNK